jgi:predicted O-methyltransferase YrrM
MAIASMLRSLAPDFVLDIARKVRAAQRTRAARRQAVLDEQERLASRRKIADHYFKPRLKMIEAWIVSDKENSNFYYDLTDLNKQQLAHFVAAVTGASFELAKNYIEELMQDAPLLSHLQAGINASYIQKDIVVKYGRRLGWYAVARILKPKILVETGVDHGVGACVLARALIRNGEEGKPGRYYGLDLNPAAGRLLTDCYADVGEMVYGDSIESLSSFGHQIDLFINDSDHSEDFEEREYAAMEAHLATDATVLSDNSHSTDALGRFARRRGMNFLFFREQPKDHWYFGAGIGAAFPRRTRERSDAD